MQFPVRDSAVKLLVKATGSAGAEPIPDLPELVLIVLLFWRWLEQRRAAEKMS